MRITSYNHPNLYTKNSILGSVLNLKTMEFEKPAPFAVPDTVEVTSDLSDYFRRLDKMTELRSALGIPPMAYCAFSFPKYGFDVDGVIDLIEWAREKYETRWWINPASARMIICIADPVTSEDAGWEYYQHGKHLPGESFHAPAWWEFCQHGLAIPADWSLQPSRSGGAIAATSADGTLGMIIGGL
jgi:hypothetical protein